MSKAQNPAVEVVFGGESRTLKFDYEAKATLEDIAGTYESATPHLKAVRAAAYACLRAETLDKRGRETETKYDRDGNVTHLGTLSIVEVGNILDAMDDVEQAAFLASLTKAMGLAEAEPRDPPKANP